MVYFVKKYRASSVPVFSRSDDFTVPWTTSDVRLYSPQRSADCVIRDVAELSDQSKKHDRQFVDDVNNIMDHAHKALYTLPPATKPRKRHNQTIVRSRDQHEETPLVVRRSWSRDENTDPLLDEVQTPATNSVLADHRYKIQERKVFAQPAVTAEPLFRDSNKFERRNSVSEVACWQAQNTIDRVNNELRRRGDTYADYYNSPTPRRHFVRSVSLSPAVHSNTTRFDAVYKSRSPSPTLQTIVVASPAVTHRVFGRSDAIGRRVDPVLTCRDAIGYRFDPVLTSRDSIGYRVDPVLRTRHVYARANLPIHGSRDVVGYRYDPVHLARSHSVGRLPTNHNEFAKMDTANFLSSAQAILDKPAIYSRNMTSLPSIYSVGGPRPVEPASTYTYKSYSKTAAPLVNSASSSSHVTSYAATPLADLNSGHTTTSFRSSTNPPSSFDYNNYSATRSKAPLSEVRKRVRGVLCKVKKDPNYFA